MEATSNCQLNIADILPLKGDFSLALELCEKVPGIVRDPTTLELMKWRYPTHLFTTSGEALPALGDLTQAKQHCERASALAEPKQLIWLELRNTPVTDAGLKNLAGLKQLAKTDQAAAIRGIRSGRF